MEQITIPAKKETVDTNGSYSVEEAQEIIRQHKEQERKGFEEELDALLEKYGLALQINAKIVVADNGR